MPGRKHLDCVSTFEERCSELAQLKRERAAKLPRGPEREGLEKEIRQLETATQIHNWLGASELRAPE